MLHFITHRLKRINRQTLASSSAIPTGRGLSLENLLVLVFHRFQEGTPGFRSVAARATIPRIFLFRIRFFLNLIQEVIALSRNIIIVGT
jgi:hypothetical protein